MSDKTPGAYKHLCGNDKRKKKLKEDEDSAKLAEKSAKFFKNFKARVLFRNKIIHDQL